MADELGSHRNGRPARVRRPGLHFAALLTAVVLVPTGCGNRADTSGVGAQAVQGSEVGQTAANGAVPGASGAGGAQGVTGAVPGVPGATTDLETVATGEMTLGESEKATTGGAGGTATGATASGKDQAAKAQGGNTGDCSKPIVIGSVGEYSGVLGSIESAGTIAVRAWAASVNALGGFKCHQVKYLVYDAGGDPSRQQALTRRAVEEDGVIAFVYSGFALAGQAAVSYIQEKRIPVIGEEGGNSWSCTNSMYFPVMTTCADGAEGNYAMLAKVIPAKDKKIAAVTCVEVPFCSFYSDNAAALAKKYGLDLVYSGSISLTQPDYTSSCVLAQRAGASRIVFGGDSTAMSRFLRSCSAVGYKPILTGPGTAFAPLAPETPELDGAWTVAGVKIAPATDPAVAAALQVLQKYARGTPLGPNSGIGWASAKVFEQALRNVSGNPTSQDVLDGLWSLKNYTAGGLTRPLTYERDGVYKREPRCWFPVHIENKQWVASPTLCG